MSWYEKSKGWSYVATNISLSTVDPAGKVVTLAGGGFFLKIGGKLGDLKKLQFLRNLNYHSHITTELLSSRWWTTDKIKNLISNPYKTWKSIDNLDWKIWVLWESATVYFYSNNQYIVINDKTSQVIQVSDLNDSSWVIDSRIYDIK